MIETITIPVATASSTYEVEIGAGLLPTVGERADGLSGGGLSAGNRRAFVVTSPEIWKLWGKQLSSGFLFPLTCLIVPAGEEHKRLATVARLAEELAQHGAVRDSILIAFGGGVIGDITGFLAASYMRGVRYIQVPTTLLAQVDSSVGGKTGVNLAAGKNLVGAFHQPLAVYADIDTLNTLPDRELRAGLQESVKAGIIRDAALFHFMETSAEDILARDPVALKRVIASSVGVKADVVSSDEKEGGLRMILNLGHTLGHAIEAATAYTQLLHGEAVAWGMIAATEIAMSRGLVTPQEAARIDHVIRLYGPLQPFNVDPAQLVALTAKDKKNRSGVRSYVVPVGIGNAAVLPDVTDAELTEVATRIAHDAGEKVLG